MKICPKCKHPKKPIEFSKNKKRKDGLQNYCKVCKAIHDHSYYMRNKQIHKERVRKYLINNKLRIWSYLMKHPCIDCGEKNPVVLEFDNKSKYEKKDSIAFMLSYSKCSWGTLNKEIKKCEIRCANCHRIKTANQLGWYKFLVP